MEFNFEARVSVTIEHHKGDKGSNVKTADFNLNVPTNVDEDMYLDKHGLPTKDGSKILTLALVQGLIGNIHYSKEMGFRDDSEHLRWIIAHLERGFATVTTLEAGEFKNP